MDSQYKIFESARQARDPRFDGRFFVGVKTTGIYCRPVCPVKMPMAKNVSFFASAAAAMEAGYRPCLQCRPEASPGTPAWMGTSTTVSRALRLIGDGALDGEGLGTLSARLGVSPRHLSRLFQKHLSASPMTIAQTRRIQFAKKLLDETNLSMTDIAFSSGYGSVCRFNDHFRKIYSRTPVSLQREQIIDKSDAFTIRLSYRPPFDYRGILSFLAMRAIPGVETVSHDEYQRTILVEGSTARISITNDEEQNILLCKVEVENSRLLIRIVEKVRRLFDLDAVPRDIQRQLQRDRPLARLVKQNPGQRLPGAWDAFELTVRAIIGQQVSVKGASTVMGLVAEKYGNQCEYGTLFPGPSIIANIDPGELPMPVSRARAIVYMAEAVLAGDLALGNENDRAQVVEQLVAIKGIGPWTAQYVAMRAFNDPDAFLHSDLVLLRVARDILGIDGEKQLLQRAEKWRPWRAYAGMHLWRNA